MDGFDEFTGPSLCGVPFHYSHYEAVTTASLKGLFVVPDEREIIGATGSDWPSNEVARAEMVTSVVIRAV